MSEKSIAIGEKIYELRDKLQRLKGEKASFEELELVAKAIQIGLDCYEKETGIRCRMSVAKLLR
jgi:hypothetical protein